MATIDKMLLNDIRLPGTRPHHLPELPQQCANLPQ
jgi:hypothetical protein